ncbi:MAG: integration host factor subunit beta [bacterium]|nr:integration host factor subunit beta [bacterium]
MTKKEIAAKVSSETGITKKQAVAIINDLLGKIKTSLVEGEKIEIRGFGVLQIRYTKRKVARNLQSNTEIIIEHTRRVKFIPGKKMKELVNNEKP